MGGPNILKPQSLCGPHVILDDARPGRESARLFRAPAGILCARSPAEVENVLGEAEHALGRGLHVAGYFAYELGYLFEPRLAPLLWSQRRVPLIWLGVFERCETLGRVDANPRGARAHAGALEFEWNEDDYAQRFARLHRLIEAGDLYQANLTFRARFPLVGDAAALYGRLRQHSRAGYCAFIDDGERRILSLSPELFFDISADGEIRAKPMKGTAARGDNATADALARAHLAASEKDRAENLMIVDLLRNDLSRVARIGSVTVDKLFEVETYPTLHQMVSTIRAQRLPESSVTRMIRALFPCGSVTGAPKIRAMEVIRELEQSPRGIYCGAIGHFSPDGSASFNVAIRTLTISGNTGELGIGGGVVHDSASGREYDECILKARYYEAARIPLRLIETLRWSGTEGFVRLNLHVARLLESAAIFGIPVDHGLLLQRLNDAVSGASGTMRVRVTLSDDGDLAVAVAPVDLMPTKPWRYVTSPLLVDSGDELLRHKTSRREMYDSEHARAAGLGVDEILFLNERGEITEGSRTNVFAQLDGRLVTPPLSCGLLNGCLRRELLGAGDCVEAIITPADLKRATGVHVGNSLRGLIPAAPL
jgi:para-aminobenzoate synthetase/4-amino-4-deoxychorismate lyase